MIQQHRMKTNFSYTKIGVLVAGFFFAGLFTTSTHAATLSLCAKIDTAKATLESLAAEKETRTSEASSARAAALATSRKEADKALYDARVAANATYAAEFKALLAQADTDEKKAAVLDFKKTVIQALETRRANVDLAVKNYRAGVDAALSDRASAYKDAVGALKASLKDAAADCSRTDAKTAVQSARGAFQAKAATIDTAGTFLETLASARDAKLASIDAKFNTTLEDASAKLKAALGE